jgi:hypothetical protein
VIGGKKVVVTNYFRNATDQGKGRLRIDAGKFWLGIYKWEGESLFICYRDAEDGRPSSFDARDGQKLLILHRVKPGK